MKKLEAFKCKARVLKLRFGNGVTVPAWGCGSHPPFRRLKFIGTKAKMMRRKVLDAVRRGDTVILSGCPGHINGRAGSNIRQIELRGGGDLLVRPLPMPNG